MNERTRLFGFTRKDRPSVEERRVYDHGRKAYLQWHIMLGRSRDIIDFDLNTQPLGSFVDIGMRMKVSRATLVDWHQIIGELSLLQKEFINVPDSQVKDAHSWTVAKAQSTASLLFARRQRGDKLNPQAYIEGTNDITFDEELIPDELLEDQKETVLALARDMGIDNLTKFTLDGYRKDHELNPDEAKEALRLACLESRIRLERFLGESFNFPFRIVRKGVDDYWSAWSKTDEKDPEDTELEPVVRGGFVIQQNLSGRIWTPGRAEELGSHEGHHINRMGKRKEQIEKGTLDRFFGLTTVHGPESIVEEGLAQTITFFVPGAYDALSSEGKFQVQSSILKQMVYANVSIMLNQDNPTTVEEATSYVKGYIPWEGQGEIDRQINWRTQDKLKQMYLPAYGFGARHFMEYAQLLNNDGKREFLKSLFTKPYTISQVEALFIKLIHRPRFIAQVEGRTSFRPDSSGGTLFAIGGR